jgi:CheY-specific phosphatase CheX
MLSLSRADRKMASGDFEEKVKPKKKKTKPNNSSHNSTLGILGLRDGIGTSVVSSHTTSMMPSSLASSMTMMEELDEMVDEAAASGVGSGVGSGSNMRPKRSATELPMTPNTFAETTSSITPMRTLGM